MDGVRLTQYRQTKAIPAVIKSSGDLFSAFEALLVFRWFQWHAGSASKCPSRPRAHLQHSFPALTIYSNYPRLIRDPQLLGYGCRMRVYQLLVSACVCVYVRALDAWLACVSRDAANDPGQCYDSAVLAATRADLTLIEGGGRWEDVWASAAHSSGRPPRAHANFIFKSKGWESRGTFCERLLSSLLVLLNGQQRQPPAGVHSGQPAHVLS